MKVKEAESKPGDRMIQEVDFRDNVTRIEITDLLFSEELRVRLPRLVEQSRQQSYKCELNMHKASNIPGVAIFFSLCTLLYGNTCKLHRTMLKNLNINPINASHNV